MRRTDEVAQVRAEPTSRRLVIGITAVLVAGLVLAACSSSPARSSKKAGRTTTTTRPATTTTTRPATTTTTAPAATTTTTTAPPVATTTDCQQSQLQAAESGSTASAGTVELTFTLTNVSATTCTMKGYVGMELIGATGAGLPTTVHRGGNLDFESVAVTGVSLTTRQQAYFNIGYSDVTGQPPTCSVGVKLEITPPTDTTATTVDLPAAIHACEGGLLDTSPVFGATDTAATRTTAPAS